MRKTLTLLLVVAPLIGIAQKADSINGEMDREFAAIINFNRNLSFLALSQGFGNLDPLLFEGRINPNFSFSHDKSTWALDLNIAIVIRMLNEKSFPVPSPSYMPALNFHRKIKGWDKSIGNKLLYDKAYWSATIGHHSNGQPDSLFNDDGTINKKTGSFSTNFFQVALTSYSFAKGKDIDAFRSIQLMFEHHPSWPFKWYSEDLEDLYGFTRLFATYNTYNLPGIPDEKEKQSNFLRRSRVKFKLGWIFGNLHGTSPWAVNDRIITEATYIYHPRWLDEVALFAQVYHGQDYYNVQFENTITVFRLGLISDPLDMVSLSNLVNF